MDEKQKQELQRQSAFLNQWAFGGRKRTRRLSYAEAWREAQRCKLRLKLFGHY